MEEYPPIKDAAELEKKSNLSSTAPDVPVEEAVSEDQDDSTTEEE